MAEVVEYFPAPHSVHVVAPAFMPVFVIEPAAQSVHKATFEAFEYLPAEHAVHVVAPALVPVPVLEPATHTLQ